MDTFKPEALAAKTAPTQPNNRQAEEAVLGSVLINPEVFKFLDLDAQDFYIIRHQWIWEAYQALVLSSTEIDIITLAAELERKNRLQELGGQAYITGLINSTPSSLHAEIYAGIIRDCARRREIVRLAHDMVKAAYTETTDLEAEIPNYMTRLVSGAKLAAGAEHISQALSKLYDEVQERYHDPRDIWGIATDLYEYDMMTGGHHKGELTLLSGKPGLGKSIIAMQMAMGMANQVPGAIYELEMGATQTVRRSVSTQSRVAARKMRNGHLADADWEAFTEGVQALEKLPVYLSDYTGWTTASLRSDLARLKAQRGIEWFIVDYLYLLNDRYGKDDHERIAYISKSLKNICKDLDLAGLVIHSMTKSEMDSNTPSLAGMRGSGQLAYDTDVAIYLLEDGNSNTTVKLYFAKFREDTPERYIRLQRDAGFPAFKAIEKPAQQQATFKTPYRD